MKEHDVNSVPSEETPQPTRQAPTTVGLFPLDALTLLLLPSGSAIFQVADGVQVRSLLELQLNRRHGS